MDKDPSLKLAEAELNLDNLKQRMYQSVLELLMSEESDTHVVGYEKLESPDDTTPPTTYVRHRVDREVNVKGSDMYHGLKRSGIEKVLLNYVPDQNNRLDSLHGELVTMAVDYEGGTHNMLKMKIQNSGHLEEIEATATTQLLDGIYVSDDATMKDLEKMAEIADAIKSVDD